MSNVCLRHEDAGPSLLSGCTPCNQSVEFVVPEGFEGRHEHVAAHHAIEYNAFKKKLNTKFKEFGVNYPLVLI